jgi:hypothetical protein
MLIRQANVSPPERARARVIRGRRVRKSTKEHGLARWRQASPKECGWGRYDGSVLNTVISASLSRRPILTCACSNNGVVCTLEKLVYLTCFRSCRPPAHDHIWSVSNSRSFVLSVLWLCWTRASLDPLAYLTANELEINCPEILEAGDVTEVDIDNVPLAHHQLVYTL